MSEDNNQELTEMSADSESNSGSEINMQEQTFSLFIIKTNPQALRAAETFLRNRKWTIGSAVNMREALAYIIQKNPQYVMICADHPNKKIKVLPKLLSQAFPVKIIGYSESSAPSAMTALRDMHQTYNLYPPVSGPAIERMVLKILKDDEQQKEEAKRRKEMGLEDPSTLSDPSSGTIRLKGEDNASDDLKKSFEQARAALSQLVNSGDQDDGLNDSNNSSINMPSINSSEKGSGYFVAQGEKSTTGYFVAQGEKGTTGSIVQQGAGQNQFSFQQSGPKASGDFSFQQNQNQAADANYYDDKQKEGETFAEWEERVRKNLEYRAQKEAEAKKAAESSIGPSTVSPFNQDPLSQSAANESNDPYSSLDGGSRKKQKVPIMESDEIEKKNKKTLYIHGEKKEFTGNESIVIKGSVEALDQSVVEKTDISPDQIQHIEKATNVACITIKSERFSGYLVAALGKNRKIDKEFIDTIKKRLFSFLKANGEQVTEDDSQGLQIKEVEFEDWAVKHAEFLRKSVHDGDEIAMAFFPHKDVDAKLDASANEKMLKMSLDELKEDFALEFDLYMYMPENNKYLLYTPQGKPLYGQQKGRLLEKGVTHMHLRKESIGDVKKYRAQNYLNEKIEAYKMAQKIKKGASH